MTLLVLLGCGDPAAKPTSNTDADTHTHTDVDTDTTPGMGTAGSHPLTIDGRQLRL